MYGLQTVVDRNLQRKVTTEAWFRNPDNYIRELVECGEYKIAWDRGYLVKKRVDPAKHAQLYFGQAYPYRILLVGDQGTAELDATHGIANPKAVYPTWVYGEDAALLEEMVASPVGQDHRICLDTSVSPDERPVFNQEHRVVVTELPVVTSGPGRKFLRYLKELQEDYPECILHVHGLYSWRAAFGMGFGAADVEPRSSAKKGKVHLPSGGEERFENVVKHPQWVTVLGFKPVDLSIPRVRCMYNIKSAVWASEHYEQLFRLPTRSSSTYSADPDTPNSEYKPAQVKSPFIGSPDKKPGDQFHCNTCSLQDKCRYFREGAVCSVPGAEPTDLARYFKTRDSDMIIDGLGTLMAAQTRRLQAGMRMEDDWGELSPEVTKILNSLFDQGTKLAKLVNPALQRPGVNINVGAGGAAAVGLTSPQQLISAAVRELEARGISRKDITPQMIEGLLTQMTQPEKAQQAIEGTVLNSKERSA